MKKLLLTGGTGFLAKNILPILSENYDVSILSRNHDVSNGGGNRLITSDLSVSSPELPYSFDVVLHAAGKAHVVPKTKEQEDEFYAVNYQGTINLCKSLEKVGVPSAFVFISTVAVYGCEYGELITEEHPLNGTTPYAKSKIMAEEYLQEWCSKHHVVLSILRPSLIAGKDAPGNLGAMVNGIRKGFYMNINGGKVIKSILQAEDIAYILPKVIEKGGVYNVCDTRQPTFGEISQSIAKQLNKRRPLNIPYFVAWCLAKVGDMMGRRAPINSYRLDKMTKSKSFSNEKARRELGWEPLSVLEHFRI